MKRQVGFWSVTMLCLLLIGCNYTRAEKRGKEVLPDVRKFNQLFDKTNQKIDWHGGIGGPLSWLSLANVYDHYLVFMEFDVSVDFFCNPRRTSNIIVRVDQYEYSYASGGKRRARRTLGIISQEQWDQVREPDDIFKFLNHVPIKNEPIEGINEDLKFY